jgi:hypothetical protein
MENLLCRDYGLHTVLSELLKQVPNDVAADGKRSDVLTKRLSLSAGNFSVNRMIAALKSS